MSDKLESAVLRALTNYHGNAKYKSIVEFVRDDIGGSSDPLWRASLWFDLRPVVKRMQRDGRIEYVSGPGSGWRRVGRARRHRAPQAARGQAMKRTAKTFERGEAVLHLAMLDGTPECSTCLKCLDHADDFGLRVRGAYKRLHRALNSRPPVVPSRRIRKRSNSSSGR